MDMKQLLQSFDMRMHKSVLHFDVHKFRILGISLLLATLISIFPNYTIIPIVLIFILIFVYVYGEKVLLGLIILFYLTSPTEYIGEFRIYLNLLFTGILLYLFFTKYGLKIRLYPKIPLEITLFLILLFTTLLFSTLFSEFLLSGMFSLWTTAAFFIIVYLLYAHLFENTSKDFYQTMISLSVLLLSVRLFFDLFHLGIENFFAKAVVVSKTDLYGSSGYTGFTIFFISLILLSVKLLHQKLINKKNNILLIAFIVIHIIILIVANSRALIIAAILGILFLFLMLQTRQTIRAIFFLGVISALSIFFIPFVYELIELYLRFDTVSQRQLFWESGFQVIEHNLIFGVGPGAFENYFFSYAPSSVFSFLDLEIWKLGKPNPHSFFLFYWAENGILGIITAISFFVVFFTIAYRTIKNTKLINKESYIHSVAITGIGIGMLFRAFFESNGFLYYGFITTDLPFWLVFIILIFIYQKSKIQMKHELIDS